MKINQLRWEHENVHQDSLDCIVCLAIFLELTIPHDIILLSKSCTLKLHLFCAFCKILLSIFLCASFEPVQNVPKCTVYYVWLCVVHDVCVCMCVICMYVVCMYDVCMCAVCMCVQVCCVHVCASVLCACV